MDLVECGSNIIVFMGNTNGGTKSDGYSVLSTEAAFALVYGIRWYCSKKVADLPNRYLFFAESGVHSTVVFFFLFTSRSRDLEL